MPPTEYPTVNLVVDRLAESSIVKRIAARYLPTAATGYRLGWQLIDYLPPRLVFGAARLATRRMVRRYWRDLDLHQQPPRSGIGRLHANLATAMGCERDAVTEADLHQALWSYARYWVEAFRLPGSVGNDLMTTLDPCIHGREGLAASHSEGNGVILVLTHSGNWDMAGYWLAQNYGGFATVAERLKPESLFQDFVEYRESLGFTVYPLTGGEPPMAKLREHLGRGEIICLLGERDLKRKGQPVNFFGRDVTIPVGAAQLAQETGAALHAVDCWFEPVGWGVRLRHRIDTTGSIADVCQRLAAELEASIRLHPHDWHMLQPMWADDVDAHNAK